MSDIVQQLSFNAGELSPALYARVDFVKYKSGAALLSNFIVDYRGGATTRPGTAYVLQVKYSNLTTRVVGFQVSTNVGYILEFGNNYLRFHYNGAPITETPLNISGATNANPCVLTIVGHTYLPGDWINIKTISGMTQLNNRYFYVSAVAGNNVTIQNLNQVNIDSTAYGTYTSGGTAARIYTLPTPYIAADLALLKFAPNVTSLIITHPNYIPYQLTITSPASWALTPISFGSVLSAPSAPGIAATTLTAGTANYGYLYTAIDASGQESPASTVLNINNVIDMRSVSSSVTLSVTPINGAVAYNFYKTVISYTSAGYANSQLFGYIGQTTYFYLTDTNISPDYTQTPPVLQQPFIGGGITTVTITNPGTYTAVPTITIGGAPSITANLTAVLGVTGTPTVGSGGTGYAVGDTITLKANVVVKVASVSGGVITALTSIQASGCSYGAVNSGTVPSNPVAQISTSGSGTGATINLVWGIIAINIVSAGAGYSSAPALAFSAGTGAITCTISATNSNPSAASFFQQRLVLAGTTLAPQTLWLSQPGAYFNFNKSVISRATDSITATLVSGVLNSIKSIVSSTAGMLVFTDRAVWLVNGGSSGSVVTPSAIAANPQAYSGASDVPPIVAGYDILYVQSKGSSVRDLAYNIYYNVFTGIDITVNSSHLFYGYTINEWCWAEEPFKVVWAIRSDGTMLTLTFLKEQEFTAWTHQSTSGSFMSVAAVTEQVSYGKVDAVYTIVKRTINGNVVQYIERVAGWNYTNNSATNAWTVDAGIQYNGTPATSFSGGEHLAGQTVTGLADGLVIPPFTMPTSGQFTLGTAASVVTVGIGFTCKLQTLPLEIGAPTVQGKVKKIPYVNIKVWQTLGLTMGNDFNNLVTMKDLVIGNVSSTLTGQESQVVSGLVSGDVRTFLKPAYTVPGQYCFQQSLPLPATILGVFPAVVIGDGHER